MFAEEVTCMVAVVSYSEVSDCFDMRSPWLGTHRGNGLRMMRGDSEKDRTICLVDIN